MTARTRNEQAARAARIRLAALDTAPVIPAFATALITADALHAQLGTLAGALALLVAAGLALGVHLGIEWALSGLTDAALDRRRAALTAVCADARDAYLAALDADGSATFAELDELEQRWTDAISRALRAGADLPTHADNVHA